MGPSGPVDNSQKITRKSSFISGTGLIGTGLDNQPAEEQQPFSKIKSNFDFGLPSFDPIPQSQGNNTQGNNSGQNNEGLISDLNFGVQQVKSDSTPQVIPGGSINPGAFQKNHHSAQP